MFEQTFAIVRNTFFESIRQPIVFVLLVIATLALILSNPLAQYTMADDRRMLIDLGMPTIFLVGALLAALIATNVITREVENKTALTVVSKPVARPLFVIGKFLGVAGALTLCVLYMALVFLLVEMHSVLETVRDPVHVPVIVFGLGALIIGLAAGAWCNYFYNMVFTSTALALTTPLLALAYFLALMFQPDFSTQPIGSDFEAELWLGVIGLLLAVLVLASIAIAVSVRLSQVLTLAVTLGVFVLGLLSNWMLGSRIERLDTLWLQRADAQDLTREVHTVRQIQLTTGQETRPVEETILVPEVSLFSMAEGAGERFDYIVSNVLFSIVPNFDVMMLNDALTQQHVIPPAHVIKITLYALFYIALALSLGVILFQRREVG